MISKDGEIVLSAKNIFKDFYLPHEKSNSLKSKLIHLFQKKDKDIDTQHALRGVSFDIKKGEFFGILGRNGSGKSTLLKILAEIYQPTKGTVRREGKLVPFIELGVGFNPELTGRENVYLNGALLGFSKKEIDEKYNDIVAFAELEEFMDQKLKNYSSGMQVRLAFSVATRAEADILLVDEILAVGDADFQQKCYEYFMALKRSSTTVILVTHDMSAVREYCDRAILIEDGRIAHQGNVNKVTNFYLKLFSKSDDETSDQSEGSRWGNRKVVIDKVVAKRNDIKKNITIEMDTKCGVDPIDDVVYGFNIKDARGNQLTGFSSRILTPDVTYPYQSNERKKIIFTLPDILGNGSYSIDSVILMSDRRTVCDKWDDSVKLSVMRNESYFPIEINATMKVE